MKKKWVFLFGMIFTLAACTVNQELPAATMTATILPIQPSATVILQASATPASTATIEPTATVVASTRTVQEPIQLPDGFAIGVYASGLKGPRMMAVGPDGLLYVAERGANRVVRLADQNQDGEADGIEVVADGLNKPNSLAFFHDGSLYVSETSRVWRLSDPDANGVFQKREVIIEGLPSGGHNTRTLLFSPDFTKLYVSIGSSCNICKETDARRATIMQFNPDGSGGKVFASGLRNAVGLAYRPGSQELWATNNGRDNLGDTQPPETVYKVVEGGNYGWPVCHAGSIIDPDFGSADSCNGVEKPVVELNAHMAPLGLVFYTGTQFPETYRGNLFIALHGSWNSSVPVGYKIMRIPVDQNGNAGQAEDFATGWLTTTGAVWGRPVDIVSAPDGSLLVSDDSGGSIFRIYYAGK